jgi:hypothetical protein
MQRLFLNHHLFVHDNGPEGHPAFKTYTYLKDHAQDARTRMCMATLRLLLLEFLAFCVLY